jgi:cytochrome b561
MDSDDRGWSVRIRLLHWLTVILLVAQVIVAFGFMAGRDMAAMRWLPFHMSVGISLLVIVVFRLVLRLVDRAPVRSEPPLQRRAAGVAHASLYILLLLALGTGWFAYAPMPLMRPAVLFGALPMPTAPRFGLGSARDFASIHKVVVWALLSLAMVHIAAAMSRALVRSDGVLEGMLVGKNRPTGTGGR